MNGCNSFLRLVTLKAGGDGRGRSKTFSRVGEVKEREGPVGKRKGVAGNQWSVLVHILRGLTDGRGKSYSSTGRNATMMWRERASIIPRILSSWWDWGKEGLGEVKKFAVRNERPLIKGVRNLL